MIHKVEGIIIRSIDYGEGNKILTIFSKELGKLGVMSKGAKKTKSRLSAVSQLFTYGYFVFFQGGGLGSLTTGDVIYPFRSIHQDIIKTAWSAYIVELIDKLTEEKEANPFLFYLLHTSLKRIEEEKDPEIITRIFELQLLQSIGIKPELTRCAMCHHDHFPFRAFSIKEGGLICESCLQKDPHAVVLSAASIRLLQLFAKVDLNKIGKVEVKDETRKQLSMIIRTFMDTYLGIKIKSRNFLDQLILFENKSDLDQMEREDSHDQQSKAMQKPED